MSWADLIVLSFPACGLLYGALLWRLNNLSKRMGGLRTSDGKGVRVVSLSPIDNLRFASFIFLGRNYEPEIRAIVYAIRVIIVFAWTTPIWVPLLITLYNCHVVVCHR